MNMLIIDPNEICELLNNHLSKIGPRVASRPLARIFRGGRGGVRTSSRTGTN